MNVVFLALGATRRAAVAAEAARVIDAGGEATVLLDQRSAWRKDRLPKGAKVVELAVLEERYRPRAVRVLLFRVPKTLFRVCAPGPLRGAGERLYRGYRRRVARPADRGLARIYRRDPARVRGRSIRRAVLAAAPDLLVVADAQSMAPAAELVAAGGRFDVSYYAP